MTKPSSHSARADSPESRHFEQVYGSPSRDSAHALQEFEMSGRDSRINRAVSLLPDGDSLLDVGCGRGHLLYAARNRFKHLHGVDLVAAQLGAAKAWSIESRIPLTLSQVNINAEPLPYSDSMFDAVSAIVLLEFTVSPDEVVSEMARVARPGATLVVSVANAVSYRNRARVLRGLPPLMSGCSIGVNGGVLHAFSAATLISLLERHGLTVDYVGCSGKWWPIRSKWPALLGGDILVRARRNVERTS